MDIGMNRPKLPRALLIITVLLLTSDYVNLDSLPSCTHVECALCTSGAVAYWPMTSKTKGSDLSGYENHAMFVGLTFTDGPTGGNKGAVHFNGSSESYATVTNSPSMDVSKYPGFSFSGYVRYLGNQNKSASLIDWSSSDGYGMLVASSAQNIKLNLYPSHGVVYHEAEFPNMKFTASSWHFLGISYNKTTGRVIAFMDGKQEQKQLDKNITAGTAKFSKVGIGTDLSALTKFNYNGDMSCMMLFKVALTAEEFEIVRKFCCGETSTQTTVPEMSVFSVRRADDKVTIRWKQVTGNYTRIKVKYCQTDTENCVDYIVPNPDDTFATWFVDPDKTYYYYMMMEDGNDVVVYTSDRLVAKTVKVVPVICVIRAGNKVTISWKRVIGHYTLIKIKYCQIGTESCWYNIVPDPEDTSVSWFVDRYETYSYYMVIEDGGDVVYTSYRLVVDGCANTKTDMVAVVGCSVAGAVILMATGVILAVALWKCRRSRNKINYGLTNYTNDDEATRIALAAIRNSPRHTYANIGTIERQGEREPDVRILVTPEQRQQCTTDSGLGQATWQHNASSQNLVSAPQSDPDDPMDASCYEDIEESGQNVSQDSSYDDVRIVTQREPTQSMTEVCLNQATCKHKDVITVKRGQPGLAVSGLGQARLAKKLSPGRSNDDVASGQQSHYEQLEPVYKQEYVDFKGLSPKQLKPQM